MASMGEVERANKPPPFGLGVGSATPDWLVTPTRSKRKKEKKKKIVLEFGSWGDRTTLVAAHEGCSATPKSANLGQLNPPQAKHAILLF
jgi:hypothetical protein